MAQLEHHTSEALVLLQARVDDLVDRFPVVEGAVEALTGAIQAMHLAPVTSWFGLIHFESIVFSVGTAVFVVAFTRERAEAGEFLAGVDQLRESTDRLAARITALEGGSP